MRASRLRARARMSRRALRGLTTPRELPRLPSNALALMAASVLSVAGLIYSVLASRVVVAYFARVEDVMPPLAERAAKAGVDLVPAGLGGAKRRLARACALWATLGAERSDLARERLSACEV